MEIYWIDKVEGNVEGKGKGKGKGKKYNLHNNNIFKDIYTLIRSIQSSLIQIF